MKINNRFFVYPFILMGLILTLTNSCEKDEKVVKKDPIITWANPSDISSGTPLTVTQLNATADVAGTFVYTPAIGTVLNVGNAQNLKVDFTPIDATNYNTATKTVAINVIPATITDIDGNNYNIISIGTQIWMKENLQTTKYNNGDEIGTTDPIDLNILSESTPKYQWTYDGIENYPATYGRLYTWYAATDSRNICPTGWHLPTNEDWGVLTNYLTNNGYGYEGSGADIAKSMAAISEWNSSSSVGTPGNNPLTNNTSGFNAFPNGCHVVYGTSSDFGMFNYMWSASDDGSVEASHVVLLYDDEEVNLTENLKGNGFSVRCVKD